jgi:hypothetical protein
MLVSVKFSVILIKGYKDCSEEFGELYNELDKETEKNELLILPYKEEINKLKNEIKQLKKENAKLMFEDIDIEDLEKQEEKNTEKKQKINTIQQNQEGDSNTSTPKTQNKDELKLQINGISITLDFNKN